MRELQSYEYAIINGGAGVNGGELGLQIGKVIDAALSTLNITTDFAKAGEQLGNGIHSISNGTVMEAVTGISFGVISIVTNSVSVLSQLIGKFKK